MSLSKLSVGLASDPVGRLMHWCIFNFCQENVCCCCCAFVLCTFEVFRLSTCCFSGILLVLFLQLITKDKQDEPCWETSYSWISHAKLMGGIGLKHAKLSLFNWKEKGFESQKYFNHRKFNMLKTALLRCPASSLTSLCVVCFCLLGKPEMLL